MKFLLGYNEGKIMLVAENRLSASRSGLLPPPSRENLAL